MRNKYIHLDGVNLFYTEENEGARPVIFFVHGNSSSQATWQKQLENKALSNFRLVAFDLPAHGLSDPASGVTNGYSLPGIGVLMAKAVAQLCDQCPFILVGVSLGTNIIAEMLAYPLHPLGILLAGPCIIGGECTPLKIMKPNTCINLCFVDELTDENIMCLQKLMTKRMDNATLEQMSKDFRMVKDRFRSSIGSSLAAGLLSDQLALVKEKQIPLLVIFGDADQAVYPDYLDDAGLMLWKKRVVKLAGASHWVHLDEPEIFAKQLSDFANELFISAGC